MSPAFPLTIFGKDSSNQLWQRIKRPENQSWDRIKIEDTVNLFTRIFLLIRFIIHYEIVNRVYMYSRYVGTKMHHHSLDRFKINSRTRKPRSKTQYPSPNTLHLKKPQGRLLSNYASGNNKKMYK